MCPEDTVNYQGKPAARTYLLFPGDVRNMHGPVAELRQQDHSSRGGPLGVTHEGQVRGPALQVLWREGHVRKRVKQSGGGGGGVQSTGSPRPKMEKQMPKTSAETVKSSSKLDTLVPPISTSF